MNSHNDNADKYSNRAEWIKACAAAGFAPNDAAVSWDNAISRGIASMVSCAQSMTSRAMGIGGTDDARRACNMAAYIMLDEVSAVLAAQVSA